MTTLAMAAGMVPSALALGVGGEFRAPMAVAVISGLIVSTLLSLVFVPAVFLLVDSLERTLGRWLGRLVGARDEAPDGAVSHGA
jgi:Cu/Ag efflux pump CusA